MAYFVGDECSHVDFRFVRRLKIATRAAPNALLPVLSFVQTPKVLWLAQRNESLYLFFDQVNLVRSTGTYPSALPSNARLG